MKSVLIALCSAVAAFLVFVICFGFDPSSTKDDGYDNGYRQGFADGHSQGFSEGYDAAKAGLHIELPSQSETVKTKLVRPATGAILSGKEYFHESEIKVTASSSSNYVVSLKNANGVERVTFFVRAGETATIGVPAEYLYVYFASGEDWYGYGEGLMFGDDTNYSKDNEIMDFAEGSWEYTLYPVTDGNFSETPSSENEFF